MKVDFSKSFALTSSSSLTIVNKMVNAIHTDAWILHISIPNKNFVFQNMKAVKNLSLRYDIWILVFHLKCTNTMSCLLFMRNIFFFILFFWKASFHSEIAGTQRGTHKSQLSHSAFNSFGFIFCRIIQSTLFFLLKSKREREKKPKNKKEFLFSILWYLSKQDTTWIFRLTLAHFPCLIQQQHSLQNKNSFIFESFSKLENVQKLLNFYWRLKIVVVASVLLLTCIQICSTIEVFFSFLYLFNSEKAQINAPHHQSIGEDMLLLL